MRTPLQQSIFTKVVGAVFCKEESDGLASDVHRGTAVRSLHNHIATLAAFVSLLWIAGCARAVPAPNNPHTGSGGVAFVGVSIVPMTEANSVVRDQTVLVRHGRIQAVGARTTTQVPPDAYRIEATGKYLMPGLADMHVHLEYFDDPAMLALFVANGVTTVRNMDGRPYILEWKRRVAAGELLGPTIYTAGPLLDGDPPLRPDNTVVRNAAEARSAVAAQKAAGYDFIKVYTNLSVETYQAILSAAQEYHLPVTGYSGAGKARRPPALACQSARRPCERSEPGRSHGARSLDAAG